MKFTRKSEYRDNSSKTHTFNKLYGVIEHFLRNAVRINEGLRPFYFSSDY